MRLAKITVQVNMRHHLLFILSTFVLVNNGISIASAQENKPTTQEKYEYPPEVSKTFMKG
jgi:hypothetical protein